MKGRGRTYVLITLAGVILGIGIAVGVGTLYEKTSTNEACMSCHVHTLADDAWKKSKHVMNGSGVTTDCAACHLPPKGTPAHFWAKTRAGILDVCSYLLRKRDTPEKPLRMDVEYASHIVFNESCKKCHADLFPQGITDDAITAHLYYEENEEKLGLQCISCHLDAGHYNPFYSHGKMVGIPVSKDAAREKYHEAYRLESFENFTETVPMTSVSINMIAVPGGSFVMGSPEDEPMRNSDEGPTRLVEISPFFMSELEITWDQYWAFYGETMSEGRTPPSKIYAHNSRKDIDAVSGPTPPFGNPDQGWGMGSRPAITMTHYAAEIFCRWLSLKTGRTYRLPTEAEWEYAARGGSSEPYFFGGNPKRYSSEGFLRSVFPADTSVISTYAVYKENSGDRTAEPGAVKANPYGLRNMYGNVMEYCSDWYSEKAYSLIADGTKDPKGPSEGTEHVVRGGSYADDASLLRSAARSHTRHDAWLKTDPQNPKSIWWYSDIKPIGFRVVCEVPENLK